MDITFFGIDVMHAVQTEITSLSEECTTFQRRRLDLEQRRRLYLKQLRMPPTIGYVYGSRLRDHRDFEYVKSTSGWYEAGIDAEIEWLRAEEMRLLTEFEQADHHWLLVFRLLRMRQTINALRRVVQRREKSALSRLPAETVRDVGHCLDLNTRKSMCRFLFDMCVAR